MSLAGKRVLVTGADGFIGSHLVERLVGDGAQVRAFCLYNSQGSRGWLDTASAEVRAALDVRLGDIRDPGFVADATKGVDVVMHLAALIAIPYSYRAPESFVATNVVGTLNVLEAARLHKPSRVMRDLDERGLRHARNPADSRDSSAQRAVAVCGDEDRRRPARVVVSAQLRRSGRRLASIQHLRSTPVDARGPADDARAAVRGATTIKLGRLDTRRDLTYVTDTVDGFIRAAAAPGVVGETIQLGTARSPSIREIFEAACQALGVRATVELDPERLRPDASEVLVLESDPARASSCSAGRRPSSSSRGSRGQPTG